MSLVEAKHVSFVPSLRSQGLWFATGFVGWVVVAAALAGAIPIEFSIAAVFLFAGPHNWLEFRYALGRLPARAGKLWSFFLLSATGVVGLTLGFAAIPWLTDRVNDGALVGTVYAAWNTAFLFWAAILIWLRSRTNPRFDGGWVWPLACLLMAGVWLKPLPLTWPWFIYIPSSLSSFSTANSSVRVRSGGKRTDGWFRMFRSFSWLSGGISTTRPIYPGRM
jgi:hypothetical protein